MPDRLGLAIHPASGWQAHDIGSTAREAEEAGFEAIFTTDFRDDGLATTFSWVLRRIASE